MEKARPAPATPGSEQRKNGSLAFVLGTTLFAVVFVALMFALWMATRSDPLERAKAAFERHQYRAGLRLAKDRLKSVGEDPGASLIAARCLTRLDQPVEAEEFYQHGGVIEIDDMQRRAEGLVHARESRRAIEVYEEILRRRPADIPTMKRLAFLRLGLKQWGEVLKITDRLAAIPSEEIAALTMAGIAFHESNEFERASISAKRVLELDPDLKRLPLPKTLFWKNLARDLMASGRSEEAREYLSRALVETHDAGLMELLGLTYFQQGATDEAERCWRQAIAWNPDSTLACLHLGRMALSRQQWAQAADLLKRAADHSTSAVAPLYNLSQAYRMLGKLDEADRYKHLAEQRRRDWKSTGTVAGPDAEFETE